MEIPVKRLTSTAIIPTKKNVSDAGFDLYSDGDWTIWSQDTDNLTNDHIGFVPTGIAMAIPEGHVGLIWDRSGMGADGIHRFAGVIDSGYRGEIKVILYNSTCRRYQIKHGERIAQILIQPVPNVSLIEADELPESARGKDGFGSSGK